MKQFKVDVSEGPPITATPHEQLKSQGAADGAAAKAHGLSAQASEAVVAKRLADEVGLIGRLTEMRHFEAIGVANQKVTDASNVLAPLAKVKDDAEAEVVDAKEGHRNFLQRIVELFDRPLDLIRAEASGDAGPEVGDDFGGAGEGGGPGARQMRDKPIEPERGPALRYGWRRDLSPALVWVLLGIIAGAEFALSARAFQSIREQEFLVLLLAGLVGTGLVALAHRIGDNLAHLLEQPLRAKGRSPAKLVELCFEVPALFIGIVGVAKVRSSYFEIEHITIPTIGLVACN